MTGGPDPLNAGRAAERVARSSYGRLVPILAARNRDIAAAEDAVSEALVAPIGTWPERGVPDNPDARLITAARNRQKNRLRASLAHQEAEPELIHRSELPEAQDAIGDSRLTLMFVFAHPAIAPAARTR